MKMKNGQDCGGAHAPEFFKDQFAVITIGDRRYTICSHRMGREYCGQLIDVTDGSIVFCCGDAERHNNPVVLGLD